MTLSQTEHGMEIGIQGLRISAQAWAELLRRHGVEYVALLLRTPIALKAELAALEREWYDRVA